MKKVAKASDLPLNATLLLLVADFFFQNHQLSKCQFFLDELVLNYPSNPKIKKLFKKVINEPIRKDLELQGAKNKSIQKDENRISNKALLGLIKKSAQKATKVKIREAEIYLQIGNNFFDFELYELALVVYEKSIKCDPSYTPIYYFKSKALEALGQIGNAINCLEQSIKLDPKDYILHKNQAFLLQKIGKYEEAASAYLNAFELNQNDELLFGNFVYMNQFVSNWKDYEANYKSLIDKIISPKRVISPFIVQLIFNDPNLQRQEAQKWADYFMQLTKNDFPNLLKYPIRQKIRIGYFSGDFLHHALSILLVGLFETHDKSAFELVAFSYRMNPNDGMQKRLIESFDEFLDVEEMSDTEVVKLAREKQLDIAIDLGGYTGSARFGIFCLRVAPIQISYLGYLGTSGSKEMDYLIADNILIPPEKREHYSEKIIYLPHYQPNDPNKTWPEKEFARKDLGLPETGFVYCCFNNSFKYTPETFDSWIRILKRVDGSVLFLYANSESTIQNLRREALIRGLDSDRLIFGGTLPVSKYLARYLVADLFLDTLPYNAGTTASDALWAGLPVLTLVGDSFAGRIAASVLNSIGLKELITQTRLEYEDLAVKMALDKKLYNRIKKKLTANKFKSALFDIKNLTKNLESAYQTVYKRYHENLGSEHTYPKLSFFENLKNKIKIL